MAKDNDWLAKLLQGGKNEISQYTDIVNRRTGVDDIGDAILEQSRQPALNGKQRWGNALKAGFGSGLKASQSNIRNSKLEQLEQYTKQAAMTTAKMQAQIGEASYKKAAFYNYANNNYSDLKKWNDALGAGDEQAANSLGILLFNRFKEENPDLADKMGNIDHVYRGRAFIDNNGQLEPIYIKDLVAPLVSSLPEELAKELPNLNTLTMQEKFSKSDLFDDLKLDEKRASIANQYSSANYHNSQAQAIKQKMDAPKPKYSEATAQQIFTSNRSWLDSTFDQNQKMAKAAKAYDRIANLIEAEAKSNLTRAGSGTLAIMQRFVNKDATESAKNQSLIELSQGPLMQEFKNIYGSKATDNDLKQFLLTMPGLDKDPASAIGVARERAREINSEIAESKERAKILEEEFGYGELYNSSKVTDRVKKRMESPNVKMIAPNGSMKVVKPKDVEELEDRGAEIYE